MKLELIPTVDAIRRDELIGKMVIIIDVLRATSVITTAISNGAKEILPIIEVEEALALCKTSKNSLLGGERKALKIEGFDLSNSPLDYKSSIVKGKTIILSTTNGTKAIHHSLSADEIVIGCMLNGEAVAKHVCNGKLDVVIVCAGTYGKFSIDDFICAGKIIYECTKLKAVELEDFAAAAYMAYKDNKDMLLEYLKMASHYQYLLSLGLEEDIKHCFTEDLFNIVPLVVKNEEQIIIKKY
jgi:2-phosphosulfolactate phosphatase